MKTDRAETGRLGEAAAAAMLTEKGYLIHTRNYSCRYGEIDIIAEKDGELAFVEVKTRSRTDFGLPSEFVDRRKMQRLIKTAEYYVYNNDTALQPRFDVIEVMVNGKSGAVCSIRHIENAFDTDY